MMMNSLQRRRVRTRRRRSTLLVMAAAAVLLFGLSYFFNIGVPHGVSSAARTVASPLWEGGGTLGAMARSYGELVRSKRALVLENQELKQALSEREAVAASNVALEAQNNELKQLLGRSSEVPTLVASVVARQGSAPYDTLVLDVGAADGIAVGQRIFGAAGTILGTIVEVDTHRSLTQLFSAPGRETPVLLGESGTEALAVGKGGGNFEVRLPTGLGVEAGDIVSIPSFDANAFGVVEEVVREPSAAFDLVLFKNPVNISSVRFVEVALDPS